MKKKLSKILIATLLLGSMAGATTAMAASEVSVPETGEAIIVVPFSDEFLTYYRTYNGVLQYRVWNATQAYWVNNWTNC